MALSSDIRGPIYHLHRKIEEEGGLNYFYHSHQNPEHLQSHTLHSIALPCLCSPSGGDMMTCVLLFPWYLLHLTFYQKLVDSQGFHFLPGLGKRKNDSSCGGRSACFTALLSNPVLTAPIRRITMIVPCYLWFHFLQLQWATMVWKHSMRIPEIVYRFEIAYHSEDFTSSHHTGIVSTPIITRKVRTGQWGILRERWHLQNFYYSILWKLFCFIIN